MNVPEIQDKQPSLKKKLEAFNDRRKREFEEEYVQRIYLLHSQMASKMTEEYK